MTTYTGTQVVKAESRMAAVAAIAGALLMLVGTLLHPSSADPNNAQAAFAEYTAFQPWVAVHMTQLSGVVLLMAALVLLGRRLAQGPASEWALLGIAGAVGTIALYAALQSVDGIALKMLVDSWSASADATKEAAFQGALAVRRVEMGLSATSCLLSGATAMLFGIALWIDGRAPRWLGVLALAGGVLSIYAGGVIAYTGFSELELDVNMVASALLLVWMLLIGVYAWRRAPFWRLV